MGKQVDPVPSRKSVRGVAGDTDCQDQADRLRTASGGHTALQQAPSEYGTGRAAGRTEWPLGGGGWTFVLDLSVQQFHQDFSGGRGFVVKNLFGKNSATQQ